MFRNYRLVLAILVCATVVSCATHEHHYHTYTLKQSPEVSYPPLSIINNLSTTTDTLSSPHEHTPAPAVIEKIVIKKIKFGCSKFIMPDLIQPNKLTPEIYQKIDPKNHRELLEVLLNNIKSNKEITESNQKKLAEAHEAHLASCK